MANLFEQYFNNVAQGILNPKGNMGDFAHAAKLYNDSAFRLSPKTKFLYHCVFELSQDGLSTMNTFAANATLQNEFNLLVKTADLPKMNYNVTTKNQYNRKKNVQTSIEYEPVNIAFHDDSLGITTALLEGYYRYYYKDGNHNIDGGLVFDPRNLYKNDTAHTFRYGFDNDSRGPFFDKITIYQLSRHQYTGFTLVNPIITSIQHDSMDQADATGIAQNTISVAYEGVIYTRGGTGVGEPKGFATDHYDNSPSPLGVLGGGVDNIFGRGGVLDGLGDIFGDIAGGTFGLDTVITAINTYQNAKNINSDSIRQEGINIAAGALGGLATTAVTSVLSNSSSGLLDAVFPKSTGTGGSAATGTQSGSSATAGGSVDTSSAIYQEKVTNGNTFGDTQVGTLITGGGGG